MKKVYFFSGGEISLNWTSEFNELVNINPDEIFILSSTEIYIEQNWGALLDILQPWLAENNKIAKIITPHLNNVWIRPNIIAEQSWAMIESVLPLYKDKEYETLKINKVYSSYMFRPTESRGRLLDTLIKRNLLEEGYVTYHQPSCKSYNNFKYWNNDPITIEEEQYSKNSVDHFTDPIFYRNSFIDVVTEASHEEGLFFLTEKTIRAIMHEKPFIVIGSTYFHNRYLKEYFKLELYDEIIDYTFDNEECLQCRINDVVDNVENLISKRHELNNLYKKLLPKLQYNKRRLEEIFNEQSLIIPEALQPLTDCNVLYESYGATNSLLALINTLRT